MWMWINQINFIGCFDIFGLVYMLIGGFELFCEIYDCIIYFYNLGKFYLVNGFDLYNLLGYWNGFIDKCDSVCNWIELEVKVLYVFDIIVLDECWDFSLGLCYDWIDGILWSMFLGKLMVCVDSFDGKLSIWVGLVFKLLENGWVYFFYGIFFNFLVEYLVIIGLGVIEVIGGLVLEKNSIYELGIKWEFFGWCLELDVVLFQVKKEDVCECLVDGSYVFVGEQCVCGLELSVSGKLNEYWDFFVIYIYFDSEILKFSNLQCEGQVLGNILLCLLSFWSIYELFEGVILGYGVCYVSQCNVILVDNGKLDVYWVYNMMFGYQVMCDLKL